MTEQHYDIIGDIHGHADALRRLLADLGYVETDGVYRHGSRQALFLGDYMDRGPEQPEVIRIVRRMCDRGSGLAIMGNHEFNAIAWATQDGSGDFFRPHSPKNLKVHDSFLDQIGDGSREHLDAIAWFRQLPIWIETPDFCAVHACWNEASRSDICRHLDDSNRLTEAGLREALKSGTEANVAAELLLKGPELTLPDNIKYADRYGIERNHVRIKWWDPDGTTFRSAAVPEEGVRTEDLPDSPLTRDFRVAADKPIFFGHYWLSGSPSIQHPPAVCLDFSVAAGGSLAAYRWSGGHAVSDANLVFVPAEPSPIHTQ